MNSGLNTEAPKVHLCRMYWSIVEIEYNIQNSVFIGV